MRIFWFVQTLSVAGDAFSIVALPLLVYAATGSVAQMGLLTGLGGAGRIVAGFFAGSIADRFDRRTLLIACDAFRAVLFALVPLVLTPVKLASPELGRMATWPYTDGHEDGLPERGTAL